MLIGLLILFGLSGCSSKPKPHFSNQHQTDVVDLDVSLNLSETQAPEVKSDQLVDSYGPTPNVVIATSSDLNNKKTSKVLGLYLGPGGHRVLGHLSVMKILEERNLRPSVYVGTGLSAIVLAQYLSGIKLNKIEWNFYRFFNSLGRKDEPWSHSWISKVKEFLIDPIKAKKIQDLERILLVPLYDVNKKSVVLVRKGPLDKILMANLNTLQVDSVSYITAVGRKFSLGSIRKNFDVTEIWGVDVLGDHFEFDEYSSGFLTGLYGRAISNFQQSLQEFDFVFHLKLQHWTLDNRSNLSKLFSDAYQSALDEIDLATGFNAKDGNGGVENE